MGIHICHSSGGRGAVLAAVLALAVAGALLLAGDVIAENPALMLGGFALLSLSATFYFLGVVRMPGENRDFWESVPWGKIFVGLVYASIAIMFVMAFFDLPGVAAELHALL